MRRSGNYLGLKNNKFGMINTQGDVIVAVVYDAIGEYGKHGRVLALVQKDNKYGCINKQGEVAVPIRYNHTDEIETGKY